MINYLETEILSSLQDQLDVKSSADEDSSVVLPVGAPSMEEEIKEEGQAGDDEIEHLEFDVAAFEISPASSGRSPRRKAPSKDASQGPELIGPVGKIANSIGERLKGSTGLKVPFKIYEVSRALRQDDGCRYIYEPQLISIGPYHHRKLGLRRMEEKKFQHVKKILSRNKKVKLNAYVEAITRLEQQARECYSQSISEITRDEFVEIMLLDGCFLVEIFLQNNVKQDAPAPKIYEEKWLQDFISHDMLLLENQLPYFILRCIFKIVVGDRKVRSMAELALDCFKYIPVMPLNHAASMKKFYPHLVDLFHHHCLPTPYKMYKSGDSANDGGEMDSSIKTKLLRLMTDSLTSFFSRKPEMHLDQQLPLRAPQARVIDCSKKLAGPVKAVIDRATSFFRSSHEEDQEERPRSIPSAEELEEAGIEFKPKKEKEGSFLSIEFHKNGAMEITYIFFSDSVNSVLQNFIAFELEQCYSADTFFMGYAIFMDCLINTDKDVKILRRSRVLDHGLGSDTELVRVFNRMTRGFSRKAADTHFAELFKDINEYCGRRRNRWRANLMHNYCNTPWAFLSFFAALVLLILTMTQTFFSIFPRN